MSLFFFSCAVKTATPCCHRFALPAYVVINVWAYPLDRSMNNDLKFPRLLPTSLSDRLKTEVMRLFLTNCVVLRFTCYVSPGDCFSACFPCLLLARKWCSSCRSRSSEELAKRWVAGWVVGWACASVLVVCFAVGEGFGSFKNRGEFSSCSARTHLPCPQQWSCCEKARVYCWRIQVKACGKATYNLTQELPGSQWGSPEP